MEISETQVNLSKCEEAYRRGYSQGFAAAITNECTPSNIYEVYEWRNSVELTAPPYSGLAGLKLHGLTEEEEHRHFINQLERIHRQETQ
jgi:hypothetical protein